MTSGSRGAKCETCKRRSSCVKGCKRFGQTDKNVARVLRKSFDIKKLYNFQHEILDYISPTFSQTPLGVAHNASDLSIHVPTGYGKTLAYILPLLHYFLVQPVRFQVPGVHCIIVLPTREVAHQVFQHFKPFVRSSHPALTVVRLTGELSFADEAKLLQGKMSGEAKFGCLEHKEGPHVLVCVASRLASHSKPFSSTPTCIWEPLRFVIVDEADRLLAQEYGSWLFALQHICYEKDLRRGVIAPSNEGRWLTDASVLQFAERSSDPIESASQLPSFDPLHFVNFHKMIFTATNVQEFEGFRQLRMHQPLTIRGTLSEKAESKLKQFHCRLDPSSLIPQVKALLLNLVRERPNAKVLVFCSTTRAATYLTDALQDKLPKDVKAACLSSVLTTKARQKNVRRFRHGTLQILIATDVASRGLHIEGISSVVHFDLPSTADGYVHRIGRTARAGRKGMSIAIVRTSKELRRLKRIAQDANQYRKCEVSPFPLPRESSEVT